MCLRARVCAADFQQLQDSVNKRIADISGAISAAEHAGVSQEQLDEFTEVFQHFDKAKKGQLNRIQFVACLQSLGDDVDEKEGT